MANKNNEQASACINALEPFLKIPNTGVISIVAEIQRPDNSSFRLTGSRSRDGQRVEGSIQEFGSTTGLTTADLIPLPLTPTGGTIGITLGPEESEGEDDIRSYNGVNRISVGLSMTSIDIQGFHMELCNGDLLKIGSEANVRDNSAVVTFTGDKDEIREAFFGIGGKAIHFKIYVGASTAAPAVLKIFPRRKGTRQNQFKWNVVDKSLTITCSSG